MIQSARSMWGKTMIFLPLRELRRSDVSPDLPPVASHRYWGIMAEQMMAVFSDSTSTKRGYYVDKVRFLVVSSTKRAGFVDKVQVLSLPRACAAGNSFMEGLPGLEKLI